MAKIRKSKKDEREELKKQRLAAIAQKRETNIIDENLLQREIEEKCSENAELVESDAAPESEELESDEEVFKREKNAFQKEIESFSAPVIHDIPEFLTNPDMEDERKEVIGKLKYLLKHRFSLVVMADILETNDYSRLDEIIERKEKVYQTIEKYESEETDKSISLFSGFKKVVGYEYSKIYSEQEERMRAAVAILLEGKYFKNGLSLDEVTKSIEDIIASVIDHPEFNLACQIESEFVMYETEKAQKVLADLRSRTELKELLEELKTITNEAEARAHAYSVMDKLITGKERKIIPPEEGER